MDDTLLVACLCAGWCTTCDAYATTFSDVARLQPQARFVWIDIEEHSDALGDAALDIENFPTLMLLRGSQPLFYGTLLPHAGTLARLVAAAQAGELRPVTADAELCAGAARLGRVLPAR